MVGRVLSYRLLPIAKNCHIAAKQTENPALKRRYNSYVTDIWSIFVSFCVCAVDTSTALPQYGKSLLGAMTDTQYRELSVIVCKGLTLLIRSNQMALEDTPEMSESESESDSESEEETQEAKIRDDDLGEEIVSVARENEP